jgi:crotonobetainyl-CoA:carnitine CoA-transferase CaiB-like acyl-CoA transferase
VAACGAGSSETRERWAYFGSGNQNFREFIEAAGITAWDEEGLTDRPRLGRDRELAAEHERRIIELFKSKTAQEWEDLISEAGSECTVCRSAKEWIAHPHARESQAVIQVDDPKYGRMWQPGINARMSLTPGKVRWPAPEPDAHRDEVLAELGARQPVVAGASTEAMLRAALEGVKVLRPVHRARRTHLRAHHDGVWGRRYQDRQPEQGLRPHQYGRGESGEAKHPS